MSGDLRRSRWVAILGLAGVICLSFFGLAAALLITHPVAPPLGNRKG
jgi:hypothetical protein